MLIILKHPILILVFTQLLFSISDLLARNFMKTGGFSLSNFFSFWFLSYFLVRQVAMFGQLYVFANFELGKTSTLFGACSIVVANLLGILLLGEILSWQSYLAISLALTAFIILALN